jgi:hypothetical protein
MTSGRSELIDLSVTIQVRTEKALGIWEGEVDDNGRKVLIWVPLSQVEDNGDGTITMPEWLAKDKGLI